MTQPIIVRGDARNLPLPDDSVDLIVTSPPYYGLRSYTDGGAHYGGQIGSEPTPASWIDEMMACTVEWMRVLKPGGSMFVNLGDTYSGKANAGASVGRSGRGDHANVIPVRHNTTAFAPYKSMLLLPERYRIACVDRLGLTVRGVIVWDKPNGLPESVTDRVRHSHEDWVHLTLGPRYFAAVDEIREPHRGGHLSDMARGLGYTRTTSGDGIGGDRTTGTRNYARGAHALGRLPGSVWEIPSEPLVIPDHVAHARCCAGVKRKGCQAGLDHYAAFPTEWPHRLIRGWSPPGICTACGEGRRPVMQSQQVPYRNSTTNGRPKRQDHASVHHGGWNGVGYAYTSKVGQITGQVCACTPYTDHPGAEVRDHGKARRGSGKTGWHSDNGEPMPRVRGWREYHLDGWEPPAARPSVVLDPFGGTGTTALVAHALGRQGVSVDLSADYCTIAAWRTSDPAQLARAMRVAPPAAQMDGQTDLFDALTGGQN